MDHWMFNKNEILKNKKINEIIVPYSHDSAAHDVVFCKDVSYPSEYAVGYTWGSWNPYDREFVEGWTKTTDLTIYQQLMSGVREFDLRLMMVEKELWLGHAYPSQPLNNVIDDFTIFFSEPMHAKELVFLRWREDGVIGNTVTEEDMRTFSTILKKLLMKQSAPRMTYLGTYSETLARGNILNFYYGSHQKIMNENELIWPNGFNNMEKGLLTCSWNEKYESEKERLIEFRNKKTNITQRFTVGWALTADYFDIGKAFLTRTGSNLRSMSDTMKSKISFFIHEMGSKGISSIQMDFYDEKTCKKIIDLND